MSYDFRIIDDRIKDQNNNTVTTKGKEFPLTDYGGNIRCDMDFRPAEIEEFKFNMTYNYSTLLNRFVAHKQSIRIIYNKVVYEASLYLSDIITAIRKYYDGVMFKDIRGAEPDKMKFNPVFNCHVYDFPKRKPTVRQLKKQKDLYNDYWAVTPYNVVKQLNHIITCCDWIMSNYKKRDYDHFIFTGD